MAEDSKIEWTHSTFNPWRGCTKVSAGCANCYAETLSARNPGTLGVWGPKGTRVVASEAMWREPVKWDRKAKAAGVRHRVFCASLADVFEDWSGPMVDSGGNKLWATGSDALPWMPGTGDKPPRREIDPLTMRDVRARLFRLIDATPNLDWLILTKRPQNIVRMMEDHMFGVHDDGRLAIPQNVWVGTSVENQQAADERIPHLLRVPAAVRFLSCEPLLGSVDLTRIWMGDKSGFWNPFTGKLTCRITLNAGGEAWGETEEPITGTINWVIVGGESGPGARPMHLDWARSLRDQCKEAGVAFHFKQVGGVDRKSAGRTLDGRTWDEFPEVPS